MLKELSGVILTVITSLLAALLAIFFLFWLLEDPVERCLAHQFQNVTLYDNSGKIVKEWTGDLSVSHGNGSTRIRTSDGVIEITGGIVIAK